MLATKFCPEYQVEESWKKLRQSGQASYRWGQTIPGKNIPRSCFQTERENNEHVSPFYRNQMLWICISFNADRDTDADPAFFVNADPDTDPDLGFGDRLGKFFSRKFF